MVDNIIDAIKNELVRYGLELLQRYPKDLDVDRAVLERFAHPGVTFAWMIGHSHTHMAPMGIHKEFNRLPTYVTNLSADDHFYVLEIKHSGQFSLKEIERDRFAALSTTAVPYKTVGTNQAFWLFRGQIRVGTCIVRLIDTGGFENRRYEIKLAPCAGISELDKAALEYWGQRAVVEITHTLFTSAKTIWESPIEALAA